MRVALFVSCMVDLFRPQAAIAAVRLLERRGATVNFPEAQTCCGQFAFNSGHREQAAVMGKQLIRAFNTPIAPTRGVGEDESTDQWAPRDTEPVIALSGSCAAMVKHELPTLMEEDAGGGGGDADLAAGWRREAQKLADRIVELTQWLEASPPDPSSLETVSAAAGTGYPVAYHTGCHMRRLLGVTGPPIHTLRAAGAWTTEWHDEDQCCGFGGTFSLTEPDLSARMADMKLEALAAAQADPPACIVGSDMGCLLQLEGRLSRRGTPMSVLHAAELIDLADQRPLSAMSVSDYVAHRDKTR